MILRARLTTQVCYKMALTQGYSSNSLRNAVLTVYKRIIKASKTWEADDKSSTETERKYIVQEARDLFRKNKTVCSHLILPTYYGYAYIFVV